MRCKAASSSFDAAAAAELDEHDEDEEEGKPAARRSKSKAAKPGTAAHVLAILDLPEAKGREDLAAVYEQWLANPPPMRLLTVRDHLMAISDHQRAALALAS
mgnify:CR=1 FL=1